jgi:hypothetical protein
MVAQTPRLAQSSARHAMRGNDPLGELAMGAWQSQIKRVLLAFFRVCYYRSLQGYPGAGAGNILHGALVEQDIVAIRRGQK